MDCRDSYSTTFLSCLLEQVRDEKAFVAGTDTLCGAVVSLFGAVKKAMKFSHCSLVEALEAASLHPAQVNRMKTFSI